MEVTVGPQLGVECVRLHPEVDLEDSLKNNVAVLRLSLVKKNEKLTEQVGEEKKKLADLVNPRLVLEPFQNKPEATGCGVIPLIV